MNECCKHSVHAQIEYSGPSGPVESLVGVNPKSSKDAVMLHEMLDEWLTKRQDGEGPDHFIVYGKWPTS